MLAERRAYCYIQSLQYVRDRVPAGSCETVPGACSATPTCACLCSRGLPDCQYVNCSCKDDANGRGST
jgi:hypothetical protein